MEPCCEAAAWSSEANCSGLYSVLNVLDPESVTADMFGKSEDTEVAWEFEDERTSTRLWVVTGMGCEIGSRPIRIRFAFSDSFSRARAKSCSACTLVRCGGVGRA